jgi:hypothetical protein
MDQGLLSELVESSDLDGLVRFVDAVCAARDWEGLIAVRDQCREAVTRGKQLWGVADFAEYRMALDGPAELAGSVVVVGAGRNALGPLWEVAASSHTFSDLVPHVASATQRVLVAHERMLRGDAVGAGFDDRTVVDAPLQLAEWEPRYPVAVYRSDRADFPEMELPVPVWRELGSAGEVIDDEESCDALLELVRPWTEESNGRAEALAVAGDAEAAIRAMGPHRVRLARLDLPQAMAAMAWTAAGGGAYGRRRGSPIGRALAWHAVATLAGLDVDEPGVVTTEALAREAAALAWWRWDPGDQVGGWAFHLAVELGAEGIAWAMSATDAR